jgi:hypothetical protein
MKASVVALSLLGLETALCFTQPSPSLFRRHWTTSTARGRISRTTLKALPPIDDISNVALAIVENSNVQDFRQFAQTATESFLKSLVVRTALGMLGSYILGQIISAGKGAFFKGKERVDSGDLDLSSLYLCIFLDLIGDSSYLLPGLGETEDLIWAPISALVLSAALGSTQVGAIDLVKEALPFTDALPVATLAWALKNVYPESGLTKLLGLSPNEKKETTGRK